MDSKLRILIVEDQVLDAELCEHELRRAGLKFELQRVCTRADYGQALADFVPDVILSDFSMPTDLDGFSALEIARAGGSDIPFIFVSGTIGEERAVEAMKAGATDYVLKHRLQRLAPVVARALQEVRDRRSMVHAQQALRDSEAKLHYLAWHDQVTGLGNRPLLEDRLTQAIERCRSNPCIAVLVWDVKRFSVINDTLGREAGDAVLRQLAERFESAWPRLDQIARLSADYFGGYIEAEVQPSDIAHMVEQSAAYLSRPLTVSGRELVVSTSVGIAYCPADGQTAEVLLANAETALKQAKVRGEHYLFYESAMNARVAQKLSLENKMRRALERDQFRLHYQPKVHLQTGRVTGFEALIRWSESESEIVSPTEFIPLLEETGLILEIGEWAITKALADWHAHTARDTTIPPIAVNVSAMQLHRSDFVTIFERALGNVRGNAHAVDVEITETVLMEDIAAHSEKLLALKAMGINVAIDDFGTGYSSLSYLAKLPVDSLKIDRSFISTMMQESQSMTIVAMIISLAHALQLRVVAEGVETVEQARVLRNLGCDEAQGHLFSEALAWHACLARCNFIETSPTPASPAHGDGRLTGSASRRGMLDAQPVARGQWSGTSAR